MTSTSGSRLSAGIHGTYWLAQLQSPPKPSPQTAESRPLKAGITTPCQLRNSTQRMSRIMTIEAASTFTIFGMISRK